MRLPRRRWTALGAIVLAVAAAGWLLASLPDEDETTWAEAAIDDLVLGVEVEGQLRSTDSSTLGPPQVPDFWDYKISFMAPEGKGIDEGAQVLGFDTTELERRLLERTTESQEAAKKIEQMVTDLERRRKEDELRLAEAEARVRKARLKLEVPEELEKGHELEKARIDLELADREIAHLKYKLESSAVAAEASLAVLRSKKERADSQVRVITESIERMEVKAPRTGTVIYVTNWRGEKKKVGDSCWRGEEILELPNLNAMIAKGEVDEADAGQVAEGQRFRIRLDAHPDLEFTGEVASIWRTVNRRSWRNPVKVVRLDMALDETDTRRMRPGMRFRGTVETDRVEGTLVIPIHAVFSTEDGPVVYRKTLLGHEGVPVELGRRNDRFVQVLDGLEPGDRVAETDLARLEEVAS